MRSAATASVLVIAVLLFVWGALHVFIQPVNPAQKSPEGHFSSSCWACHFVDSDVKTVE